MSNIFKYSVYTPAYGLVIPPNVTVKPGEPDVVAVNAFRFDIVIEKSCTVTTSRL